MTVQRCKGSRDLSPDEMRRFRLIEGVFRDCCIRWGYEEVRTPTLEYLHLFTSTGTLTPARLRRVYSFLDWDGWSGERVVLRPDGTIPIARLYVDTMQEKGLAKLFYVTNVFTFEETGKEAREKWQCGAEVVGAGSTVADVELVMMIIEVLKKLGLDGVELKLSHAGLIRALLARSGLSPSEQAKVFDLILDGDVEALTKAKLGRPELGSVMERLLDFRGKSPGLLRNMKAMLNRDFPQLEPALDNFIDIVDLFDALGLNYQIDIGSGRGFEYYTGMIFQVFACQEHVGGGGRYDALIPLMGGQDVPASGFAFYLDRLMGLINPATLTEPSDQRILIKLGSEDTETKREAFSLVDRLHEAGYAAELHLGGREPANLRWVLAMQSKPPQFVLTDRIRRKSFESQTANEILSLLSR